MNPPATKTGLYVRSAAGLRLRDEKVRRLVRRMRVAMPWLEDADEPTARAWAQLEMLSDMAHTELRKRGILNSEGEPRRLLADFRQLRAAQLQYARELGMSPTSRAALKVAGTRAALDLAAAMAGAEVVDEEKYQECGKRLVVGPPPQLSQRRYVKN